MHWHLAPLPPGVPFEQQQLTALDTNECIALSAEQAEELAERIRAALADTS